MRCCDDDENENDDDVVGASVIMRSRESPHEYATTVAVIIQPAKVVPMLG
jgi:hypothetical protein